MVTYTKPQLLQYLGHIHYPGFHDPVENVQLPLPTFESLIRLQQHHLGHIPFENIRIHYDQKRIIIDPEVVFQKVVVDARGRGGYCTEVNMLFTTVLRSLGFDLITLGAKVTQGKEPEFWGHMTSLVTIDSQQYLVDVGYGANTPPIPLPYIVDKITDGLSPEQYKISDHRFPGMKLPMKTLFRRASPDDEWLDEYGFCDAVEFTQPDYQMMSDRTSTVRLLFTQNLMLVKFLLQDGRTVGKRILHNAFGVKQRMTGEKESSMITEQFESEEERIQAFDKYFFLILTEEEKKGIQKSPCAIGSSTSNVNLA